jgi:hypothetical protein
LDNAESLTATHRLKSGGTKKKKKKRRRRVRTKTIRVRET